MKSVIQVEDRYYILASSSQAEERSRVLKHNDTFAVFDRLGDVQALRGEQGLYHDGTRFLSTYVLTIGDDRPLLLSSTVRDDNATFTADLTNPDVCAGDDEVRIPRGSIHIFRRKFLHARVCYEQIRLTNYALAPVPVCFGVQIAADFVDVFEVRGTKRQRRGEVHRPQIDGDVLRIDYDGLDGVRRTVRLTTSPSPHALDERGPRFEVVLDPQASVTVELTVTCEDDGARPEPLAFAAARERSEAENRDRQAAVCDITTSNALFNDWLQRSSSDLRLLLTATEHGPYPYAGIPWFSAPFGRDALITALQYLWVSPEIAAGVLRFLAATQADEIDDGKDAEPGKILHESRRGEMAALNEVPFGRYYGSVDATPLFVMLAGSYWQRTNDDDLIRTIWPAIARAMAWIEDYGDCDGDGFVEYARHSHDGLVQQGWKDSQDSVFHADGEIAAPPIALCEVQAYVYGAYRAAGRLARLLDRSDLAGRWLERARALRREFDAAFWDEELGCYALALDGDKRRCRVRTSNAGHCLLTGLATREHAARIAATLVSPAMFTGFGIRTVAEDERRYDPMSYHNGSVWPHDNALIAAGLARYGFKAEALSVLDGLFEASVASELHRLPELFCGFARRHGEGPTRYPVACSPQAWASASVFALVQAALGIHVDARRRRLRLDRPALPSRLDEVYVHGLRVGDDASVDLVFRRHQHDVGLNVLRREGQVEVVMIK